jgi:hypothetical protein
VKKTLENINYVVYNNLDRKDGKGREEIKSHYTGNRQHS